jgi:pimeloyl-ACP methyl ester carboxylesterase
MITTNFLETKDGVRIAYDMTGRGPAIMLLHGAGKEREDWHKLGYVERLKQDFTVITVDIRGSGESEYLAEISDFSIQKICDDLLAVVDACQIEQVAVWGYSFGGNIARYLAAWSERISAIAVIGIPFGAAVHEEFDRFIDGFVKKWESSWQDFKNGKWTEEQRKSKVKGHIPVWVACFQAMRGWPDIQPGDVRCPCLLLVGSENTSVYRWVKENQQSLLAANFCIETIKGLNHAQEFNEIDQVFPSVSSFFLEQVN